MKQRDVTQQLRCGFWWSEAEPDLKRPMAGSLSIDDRNRIADNLSIAQRIVDEGLRGKIQGYRGWSNCRVCGRMNGSREYYLPINTIQTLVWPEGLLHYVKEHRVALPTEFADMLESLRPMFIDSLSKLRRPTKGSK